MDSEALFEELKTHLRAERDQSDAARRARYAELDHLSDEEYIAHLMAKAGELPPQFRELSEGVKASMLRHRRGEFSYPGVDPESVIDHRARQLIPHLLAVREQAGTTGPFTEDALHQATMSQSAAEIERAATRFAEAAERETNPKKKAFLTQFTQNIALDQEDLKVLRDPDITEERLADATKKVTDRLMKLTEGLKPDHN